MTIRQQIDDYYFKLSESSTQDIQNVYMCGSREAEMSYVIHNRDRFIVALTEIDKLAANNQTLSILDIGTSPFTFIMRQRYPKAKLTSIDLTTGFSEKCKYNNITFKSINLRSPKLLTRLKGKFDAITFLEVLEHIEANHANIVESISHLMKQNASCVLQTPNKYSPKALLQKMLGISVWDIFTNRPRIGSEFAHVKEYSLKELINLVTSVPNLSIKTANYSTYFDTLNSALVYRKNTKLTRKILSLNLLLTRSFPFLQRGMQVVFVKL